MNILLCVHFLFSRFVCSPLFVDYLPRFVAQWEANVVKISMWPKLAHRIASHIYFNGKKKDIFHFPLMNKERIFASLVRIPWGFYSSPAGALFTYLQWAMVALMNERISEINARDFLVLYWLRQSAIPFSTLVLAQCVNCQYEAIKYFYSFRENFSFPQASIGRLNWRKFPSFTGRWWRKG